MLTCYLLVKEHPFKNEVKKQQQQQKKIKPKALIQILYLLALPHNLKFLSSTRARDEKPSPHARVCSMSRLSAPAAGTGLGAVCVRTGIRTGTRPVLQPVRAAGSVCVLTQGGTLESFMARLWKSVRSYNLSSTYQGRVSFKTIINFYMKPFKYFKYSL